MAPPDDTDGARANVLDQYTAPQHLLDEFADDAYDPLAERVEARLEIRRGRGGVLRRCERRCVKRTSFSSCVRNANGMRRPSSASATAR